MILLLSLSIMGQEFVGTAGGRAFYIDSPVRNGVNVSYIGITAKIINLPDGTKMLDKDNYLISSFLANCHTYEWSQSHYSGVVDGKDVKGVFPATKNKAKQDQIIFEAINKACRNILV